MLESYRGADVRVATGITLGTLPRVSLGEVRQKRP